MKRLAWLMMLATALAVGCKRSATAPTEEQLARRRPPPPFNAGPPASIVVPDSGDVKANLEQLSLALRRYVAGTHRMPKDFDDFVARSGVQPPPPPAGKKYALQGQGIGVVNQ